MSFSQEYLKNWKNLGSILIYASDDFGYRPSVVITEFENCLIDKVSSAKLYHSINPADITEYNEEFLKKIISDSSKYSVVIMSNQISTSKLNVDCIKKKLELFMKKYTFPLLAIFCLRPNRLSKPHTGMWKFLKAYYSSIGKTQLKEGIVVSDCGGRIIEEEKKNRIKVTYDSTDIDRAFAYNIGIPYNTILEYITPDKKEKFVWNTKTLPPELRQMYVEKLSHCSNPNIFVKLEELGNHETHLILLYGAPRAGKTTLAKELIKKWRESAYAKTHKIERLGLDNYTNRKRIKLCEKLLFRRISVIVDGDCHNILLRQPFTDIAKKYNIPVLHIEVSAGIAFAYLFNHAAVETAQDENILLYDDKCYRMYKSNLQRPDNYVLYAPSIKKIPPVMEYRY